MKTLEDAAKYGCNIVREVRYFAAHPKSGQLYALVHDFTTEMFDRQFVDEKLNKARKEADENYERLYK